MAGKSWRGVGLLLSVLLVAVCLVTATGRQAAATEGGGGAYPNGAEDFMAGAVPPPGTYFLDYFTYYTADKLDLPAGEVPGFDLTVFANTFRLLHVTPHQILGGNWGLQVFIPVVDVDVELPVGSDDKSGLGDIIVDPFILSWHSRNWHWVTGLDIYLPTGAYDQDDLANIGRNYWTFEPVFGVTYLGDSGIEVSAKLMYDINTENDDTKYLSGQEFHADYMVGYHFKPWSIGVNGYYYTQVTDDEVDGDKVPTGFQGEVFAIGPAVKFDYKNMSFTAKYQIESGAENRTEGDKLWVKFLYAF